MELVWNLEELFGNEEEFEKQLAQIQEKVDNLQFERTDSAQNFFDFINQIWDLKESVGKLEIYANLRYYADIQNPNCISRKERIDQLKNKMLAHVELLENQIIMLGWDLVSSFLEKDEKYQIYETYLKRLFRLHSVSKENLEMIQQKQNEISSLLVEYNQIRSKISYGTILVHDQEVELTNQNIAKYSVHPNREIRREVCERLGNAYQEKRESIFSRFLSILKKRVEISSLKGFSSVLESQLFEEQIPKNILFSLFDAVHQAIPFFQEYLKLKANALDISNPHLYDYGVSFVSMSDFDFSLTNALSIIESSLEPLGSSYWNTLETLIQKGHFDTSLDSKKHPSITFSWYAYSFLHYHESYSDVKNLIHEMGHVMNDFYSIQNLPFVYAISSVFTGETASIVHEILLSRFMISHAESSNEKQFYLSKEIENYITSVFRQTMFTELEFYFYQELEQGHELSYEKVNSYYQKLLKQYYGNDTFIDDFSISEWLRFDRFYRWSYYSFNYATGLLIASIVVASLLDGTLSQKDYLQFLASGNAKDPMELLKILHIDFFSSDVFEKGFTILNQDLNVLKKLFDERNTLL